MRSIAGIILIGLIVSCARKMPEDCALFGANLLPGSVIDTIKLADGTPAVLTSTGTCRYDTVLIAVPVPHFVDTTPINDDTVRTTIMGFGSSTIARWDLQEAFPSKTMKKAGYKGYFIDQLLQLTDTILRVRPEQVLLYAGSNDVIAGKTTSEVTVALQELMQKIWEENPDVFITYITMHASDTAFKVRSGNNITGIQTIENVNANIIKWIANGHSHNASVVDSYKSFLAWNPKRIDLRYFEPDKLHLNQSDGYPKLNKLTAPLLK